MKRLNRLLFILGIGFFGCIVMAGRSSILQTEADPVWIAAKSGYIALLGNLGIPVDGENPELTVDGSGNIYQDELAGGYAYWLTGTTTITTGGTRYTFSGTFQNDVLENFHFSGDKIVYDGNTKKFIIHRQASLSSDTSATVVSLGIKKNGVYCTGSRSSVKLVNASDIQFIGTMDQDSLNSGDTIQLVITADKASVITPTTAQASIMKFY